MIRIATTDDITQLVDMGQRMHGESPRYSRLKYAPDKVAMMVARFIASDDALVLVAEHAGDLVGVAMAYIDAEWFSDDRVAAELVLFVLPENRGGLLAPKLIAGMDAWSRAKGVLLLQAGSTTGVDPQRTTGLYEHMGFERCAIGFERFYH